MIWLLALYLIGVVVWYFIVGVLVGNRLQDKNFWEEPSRANLLVVGGVFWPLVLPVIVIVGLFVVPIRLGQLSSLLARRFQK